MRISTKIRKKGGMSVFQFWKTGKMCMLCKSSNPLLCICVVNDRLQLVTHLCEGTEQDVLFLTKIGSAVKKCVLS